MVREVTNTLIELAEYGLLDWESIATACLTYMSEDEVADMAHINEFLTGDEDEDESEETEEDTE